jgi:hypothetical protein
MAMLPPPTLSRPLHRRAPLRRHNRGARERYRHYQARYSQTPYHHAPFGNGRIRLSSTIQRQ